MTIEVLDLKKNFGYSSILKPFSYTFLEGKRYAISGRNGSGKSTLLKMLSGYLSPSAGSITYKTDGGEIKRDAVYQHISYSAPYIDVTQEFTLEETFDHYKKFRSLNGNIDYAAFITEIDFKDTGDKRIANFSSGMKQKISLGLSILDTAPILMLDEPTSYLDEEAKEWFTTMLSKNSEGKTIITASNDDFDFTNMEDRLHIENGSVLI